MADEFLESEVIFSDTYPQRNSIGGNDDLREPMAVLMQKEQKQNSQGMRCAKKWNGSKKKVANSVPMKIPERMLRCSMEAEDDDDGEVMVPPHVMVERRISGGKMAYSVRTGNGRTLKGRDLSRVRDSILRMTGFLEV